MLLSIESRIDGGEIGLKVKYVNGFSKIKYLLTIMLTRQTAVFYKSICSNDYDFLTFTER